jgi:ketosteroid isomerase-like protein
MTIESTEQAVEAVERAFNEGNIEAVLSFYEDNAVIVTEPGKLARG